MDLFLKVESYEALQAFLQQHGCVLEGNYHQCDGYIIDYIGKIPKINEETGEVVEWSRWEHFNVRLVDEDINIFDSFESVLPDTPYRKFS